MDKRVAWTSLKELGLVLAGTVAVLLVFAVLVGIGMVAYHFFGHVGVLVYFGVLWISFVYYMIYLKNKAKNDNA
jgi:hypothetical protein